jgi:hypothetical protein
MRVGIPVSVNLMPLSRDPVHVVDVCTNVLTFLFSTAMLSCRDRSMRFTWDENKNRQNLSKHDVRFETAVLVFDDPYAMTQRDYSFDDEER